MPIELPELPYPGDALEPVISRETLATHHGKHHRAYVSKVNALARDTVAGASPLETIIEWSARRAATDASAAAIFNNAAQAFNHAFYWRSLCPPALRKPGPQGELAALINSRFGTLRGFTEAFKAAATGHFGSGWAWLVVKGRALEVVTTANADTPIVQGAVPLLTIDVWEHAYYLDYRARRAAYVDAVVDRLLDWAFAEHNFNRVKDRAGGTTTPPVAA